MPKATRRDRLARLVLIGMLAGCRPAEPAPAADGGAAPDASMPGADAALDAGDDRACPAGAAGLACVMSLFDRVAESCDADQLDDLQAELAARHGRLPLWQDGRALFVSYDRPAAVAGDFNGWQAAGLITEQLCGREIYAADAAVASGRHAYKLVVDGTWQLDPENWAFAYDDFAGNADGANSILNTYDSGLGHLVSPELELCSAELGNCRRFITYLPAGYGDPANDGRRYPALFMHDGQNIFDDTDCCFGHTGWEVNVQLDADIAAGTVEPVVVIGVPHAGADRADEYGYSIAAGGRQELFMTFQVDTVQPRAAELWRLDADRYVVAGSSLGGLLSFRLAFAYPDLYAGAASLSGAFWVGADTDTAMSDTVAAAGYTGTPLYLDHGGSAQTGGDNYGDNVALRDQLVDAGWTRADSPDCSATAGSLCYFHDDGASHDELAWRDRSFRFLRYFFTAPASE